MSIHHFTDKNFKEEVLESNLLVLVDFYAQWCAPCKMISPILDELAKEYAGKIKIGKMDVDENQKTPTKYGVISIPTLVFFKNGQVDEQCVGLLNKVQLKKKIEDKL